MRNNMKIMSLLLILISAQCFASFDNKHSPPNHITSLGIVAAISKHFLNYTHYKVIGSCFWYRCNIDSCETYPTLELDEYLPDLVVTVFNQQGDNPWMEASSLIDKSSHAAANTLVKSVIHFPLSNGSMTTSKSARHYKNLITKSVDVIGAPNPLAHFPFVSLSIDTVALYPYYQSDLDVISQRTGAGEAIRFESLDLFHHFIGESFKNHWGYEFPRSMTVNTSHPYKAAVIIAQRAADLVTNKNSLHLITGTDNRCGKNCAVANVIEETKDNHEIWQEVYPHDRHIRPGEADTEENRRRWAKDEKDGHGNYVFVVWRHYRGCVQGKHYINATRTIPSTKKR